MRTRAGAISGAALAVVIAVAACGERKLSAEEFVSSIEDEGVEVKLEGELYTNDESKELYGFEVEPVPGAPRIGEDEGHAHGSLAVYDEVGNAEEGVSACQAAGLLCYRAANVVVILEDGGLEARRLGAAVEQLGES